MSNKGINEQLLEDMKKVVLDLPPKAISVKDKMPNLEWTIIAWVRKTHWQLSYLQRLTLIYEYGHKRWINVFGGEPETFEYWQRIADFPEYIKEKIDT